ncbi:hypothetical protein BEK98_44940 [Streptomyces diastatochromogenes]|uniref:Uncharacterized protein n=2 Tax=Streptomyces diastatochromogenes TaxID=42236 RepID=A0A233RRV3_STRDA|nr:hypothetical protein BEK98_44940 [Streptomyces diastatochromogenes]
MASRANRERSRDKAGQWTAAGAARDAHRMREQAQPCPVGNPWVQTTLASNMNNALTALRSALLHSDLADSTDRPEGLEWDAALSMTPGKQGYRPPWPRAPREATAMQIRQIGKLLRQAKVLIISPAAHAAVMAAAATLEPADISTLDRDRDIVVPTGLLVLPESTVVVIRTGSLSDTKALGRQFMTQHQILPTAQYPGVRVTAFMDRDGPVQPSGWRQMFAFWRLRQWRRSGCTR